MNGLRWHKLTALTQGDQEVEVMGATCIDGIGVIIRWKRTSDGWTTDAIDTEGGWWGAVDFEEEGNEIPAEPPTAWDDMPSIQAMTEGATFPSDATVAAMPPTIKKAVHDFLIGQAKRFEVRENKTIAVEVMAADLEALDKSWRHLKGYTGTPVHREAYWRHLASGILGRPIDHAEGHPEINLDFNAPAFTPPAFYKIDGVLIPVAEYEKLRRQNEG